MKIGEVCEITLGKYGDRYLVTAQGINSIELKRVMVPKTKIDAVRLPERVSIRYFSTQLK